MGTLEVRLLGHPAVVVDGAVATPPRGAKAWGVLAFLAASERPRSRAELAEVLFDRAEDPLGALRWNLAALRRLLGQTDALKGEWLDLELPEGATIDTRAVDRGDPGAVDYVGSGRELLAGLSFADSPLFETWLLGERRRLNDRAASLLRDAALRRTAHGDHAQAIHYASQLVAMNPLDESHHALLIRAHALAGDPESAREQLECCRRIMRRELGTEPGPAVSAAARAADTGRSDLENPASARNVESRVAVAWQSFLGGAVDHALDLGRGAVAMSDECKDDRLRALTRTFLGAMLGIAVRGWDEGATALAEATCIAEELGRIDDAATAAGVRAGIDMMRGDYGGARASASAGLAASDDPGARALNLMFLAAIEADTGSLEVAMEHAEAAVVEAEVSGDPVRVLYSAAHEGRIHLMQGTPEQARPKIERALSADPPAMFAIRPWPMTVLAEIELAAGEIDTALRITDQASATAGTTGISYQQAMAERVLGLAEAALGNTELAVGHLTTALRLARRTTGEGYTFHWPIAFILESMAAVTACTDRASSRLWASTLLDHASNIGMSHFVTSAQKLLAETL